MICKSLSISLGLDNYNSLGLHTIFMHDNIYYGAHGRAMQGEWLGIRGTHVFSLVRVHSSLRMR